MGVSRDTLDRIKAALDPLAVVREAVPSLKQSGARWKGNCPFHNERTPSFYFQPEKGLWHCFGACQEGGDIMAFVMKLEGLSFTEALRELARRTGIPLDWDKNDDASSRRAKERDALLNLLEEAAGFYRDNLRSTAEAEIARRTLAQRGVRPETIDRFRIGYAPRRDGFLDRALKRGVAIELLLKAGLAARSDRTGRYQDTLTGRLIFPIRDAYGQVVAFGGRVLEDDAGPKYINSPETPVYTKGRHLYGLYEGRTALRDRGQAVVVEGYMDVVGLHQAGVDRAVAPLGTGFTTEQAKLLRRYAQETVLLFDPDPAGQRASWRTADVLLKDDVFVRVAQVPDGLDPDEYVQAKGPAAMEGILSEARDVVDFWLDLLAPSLSGFNDLHGRLRKAEELLKFIGGVPNEVLREEWIKRAAARLNLDAAALKREMGRKGGERPSARPEALPPAAAPAPRPAPRGPTVRTAEEELLQVLGAHPALWPRAEKADGWFADTRCLSVFRHWRDQWKAEGAVEPAAATAVLGAADGPWLTALLLEGKSFEDPAGSLERALVGLERQALQREKKILEGELRALPRTDPGFAEKFERHQTLTRRLKAATPDPAGPTER